MQSILTLLTLSTLCSVGFASVPSVSLQDLDSKEAHDSSLSGDIKGRHLKDHERYMLWMKTLKEDPKLASRDVARLLKDSSWLLRSAALTTIQERKMTELASEISDRLLHDPAMVVRTQAAQCLGELKLSTEIPALLQAVASEKNQSPNWVALRSLEAVRAIQAQSPQTAALRQPTLVGRQLFQVLKKTKNPELRAHLIFSIDKVERKQLKTANEIEKYFNKL